MNRRNFFSTTLATTAAAVAAPSSEPQLRCTPDGSFTVLMISDLHFTHQPDPHALALANQLLDTEKPNFVVVAGDCLSGKGCSTPAEVRAAVANVAAPMEAHQTPWAITFGNHDQEHFPKTQLGKDAVLDLYAAHKFNRNSGYARGLHGAGNKTLLVWNAAASRPVYCLWLLDSNDYFMDGKSKVYDWIHSDQVDWYYQTSLELEKTYGAKIPGLMFFHIPLREFGEMVNKGKIIGARHESEAPSPVHSGLFPAVLERGDVRGIYCGHDHTNNYVGRHRGVELGYDGALGHNTYPHLEPTDPANNHVRGGRLFRITESPAAHTTWMRFKGGHRNWEADCPAYVKDNLFPS